MTDRTCTTCPSPIPATAGNTRKYCDPCQVAQKRAHERQSREKTRAEAAALPMPEGACKDCRGFCGNVVIECARIASALLSSLRGEWEWRDRSWRGVSA